jgi:hypothetical protein
MSTNVTTAKPTKVAAPKLATAPPTTKKRVKQPYTPKFDASHQHRNQYVKFCKAVKRAHAAYKANGPIKTSNVTTIESQPGGYLSGHYYKAAVAESQAEPTSPENTTKPLDLKSMHKEEQRKLKALYRPQTEQEQRGRERCGTQDRKTIDAKAQEKKKMNEDRSQMKKELRAREKRKAEAAGET